MTKMVQLSDAAYQRLKAQKRKGESFSDVVLRLAPGRSLLDLGAMLTADEISEQEQRIQRINALDRADAARGRPTERA